MSELAGYVYLVGAGPGDSDLLTIKAKKAIEKADVLIYDRLISNEILRYAPVECELLFVGKSPGKHYRPQSEINELLVKKALEGKIVVRLKGGDPFVFGRGGEEALALKKQGIAFDVIPGVSSAIAVPAFAGIPVTHRGVSSSFTVITGHEDPQKCGSSLDWEHIGKSTGTLVFLMGMLQLPMIAEKLMENGMDVTTPVAVIENGGSPQQRTVCGELGSIVALVERQQLGNPAVIVVGPVVSLREELRWFEKKPLFGQNIMVTRARQQASGLSAALADLGASVVELPMISFCAPSDPEPLRKAVEELPAYDWLIFTSVNGVEAFFAELYSQGYDARRLAGIKLVAIGPATRKALEQHGLRNLIVPQKYCAEGIADTIDKQLVAGEKVLLARAEEARELLPRMFTEWGALVTDVAAYKTIPADIDAEALITSLRAKDFDAITFTSSSTVHTLLKTIGGDTTLLSGVRLYSIGPVTSETLRVYGLKPAAQAASFCVEGLAQAIVEYARLEYTHPEHAS